MLIKTSNHHQAAAITDTHHTPLGEETERKCRGDNKREDKRMERGMQGWQMRKMGQKRKQRQVLKGEMERRGDRREQSGDGEEMQQTLTCRKLETFDLCQDVCNFSSKNSAEKLTHKNAIISRLQCPHYFW